ncbi:TetR/AcrR family transcriptional regulator [Cyclobacterium jeungdonense]|uniref:TetR/AcrR family transcriptional regulator n=1 Tax=Cyclobacterium jeungdonense TaxID=708087 RepID=A0ABT8C6W1_9BACT|nr:TetR/AcrR family transcriptional regulator [Cyclobacterium jeungdonense]MDN3688538.1 TetR/AcrR family transcriptional regulator [Cyclobacterium jeungdonense]
MKKKSKTNTKQRIIDTAIDLFNKNGIQNITSRHIATEMGISYGNLDYHYKNKEALLLAIYKQMRDEMSDSYTSADPTTGSFEQIHRLLLHLESFQYKFRFFNLDVLEISRSYPKINRLLKNTFRIRKEQMADMLKQAIADGFFIKSTEENIGQLLLSIRIIITFWLSQEELLSDAESKKNDSGMSGHIWQLLLPYMTENGQLLYDSLVAKSAVSN